MAQIIDGKKLGLTIRNAIAAKTIRLTKRPPALTVILVGENPASQVYVYNKHREAEKAGITSKIINLPSDVTQAKLLETVERCNRDKNIDGILVQLPLPRQINTHAVLEKSTQPKMSTGCILIILGRFIQGAKV